MVLNIIEYCDVCFYGGKTHLCETYKGIFTKINQIHFSQQNKLDKLLYGLNVSPKLVERRWTCILDKSQRSLFLGSLWGVGLTVHTLEDHVKILTKLYRPEIRKLGTPTEIELPSYESWHVFDPKKREWMTLEPSKKQNRLVVKVRLGAVLKSQSLESDSYFRTISNNDKPELAPLEKRAAYNIMATQLEPAKAYWQTDEKNLYGFIKIRYLQNLPEEIFTTLIRLQSHENNLEEYFSFDNEDFVLVKTVLSSVKIGLETSSELVVLAEKPKQNSLVLIDEIEKDRLTAFIEMIKEIGGKVESDKERLTISGKIGSVKLGFIKSEKSIQEGQLVLVSLHALEDPQRTVDLVSMIKKRLGLLGMSIENLVCRRWQIITDSDLQYVVQSIIEYSKIDKALALSVLDDQKKFDKVKEWNSKIKEGTIRSNLDTIALGKILKLRQ